ncbi:alanine and proline rich protein [Mycobacterium tuberculosis OFXR-1]|nr:alanine and proline rich protein [Mycobacterium tuberculosis 94_M4241A]KBI04309.1 alanine and proline rich protein [Mycobacterium tuberculosis MAL020147]KBJ44941.1 alanine and proline rich protein [Mycobacterium tuberculosis OFXR-1]KCN94929.1 alanine and proline rich protein [Mycobacterium tuberculosis BTB07-206]
MASTWSVCKGLAAVVITSAAAFALCPNAAADPATPQPNPTQQLPGLPALAQLSPIIQQAAMNPAQATQLLMAAASAFAGNPAVPTESKNVASSVNQFVAEPTNPDSAALGVPAPHGVALPEAIPVPHVPPLGAEPGVQAHLPTGIDPSHAAGPAPAVAPTVTPPVAAPPASAPAPAPDAAQPVAVPGPPPAPASGFGADAPPTQDFMYPSIGPNCVADGSNSIATALSVAGPAKIPLPGPGPGQTAYVFTAVGTPGPADVQRLPLNVTWVNLTTGKSGSATLRPRSDINPDGPTTLTVIADTGSGSIMSTIFGQVTTKDRQCQFMPTIGSTVVP